MKHTTSRKKMLLSSVAMLLVAASALGSATFAWFSTKTSAEADNVHLATAQASSLVLSLNGTDWSSTIDLALNSTSLDPGSTSNLTNWFAATSTGYDQGTVDTTTITSGTQNTNYLAKTFYIKSIGADMDVDWNLALTEANAQNGTDINTTQALNYARVALKVTGQDGTAMWWSNDGVTTKALTSTAGATSDVTSSSAIKGTLASLTKDTAYTLTVYTWFEGQDADCIDTNAAKPIDFDLKFTKSAS
jgi:hypothetical protein